jgi:lipoprotein-anchoring transpeptidase ErfK/SrfK
VVLTAAFAFVFNYNPFWRIRELQPPPTTPPNREENTPKAEEPVPEAKPEPKPEVVVPPQPVVHENLPESAVDPNPEVTKLIRDANEFIYSKPAKIIKARTILNEAFKMPMTEKKRNQVRHILSELSEKWLFSKKHYPDDPLCGTYKVQPGDILANIAKKYKVPWEGLRDINKIGNPKSLQAGQIIKVVNGPFRVVVHSSIYTMDLYLQEDTFVRSFEVGLGMAGNDTPTGVWKVAKDGKLEKPTWASPEGKVYHPEDPNYPLGSRYIGIDGVSGLAKDRTGFAIHGTKDADSIGESSSQGCIRLHNGEVILLYNLLVPGYSFVDVMD